MIRRSVPLLTLVLILLVFMAGLAMASGATDTVKTAVDKVLSILQSPEYSDPAQKDDEAKKIRDAINTVFDFEEFSMRAVGRPWRDFNETQKSDFQKAFADLMSATYMDRIQAYSDEKVQFTEEVKDQYDNVEVRTQIVSKDKNIPIYYRMKEKNGSWVVYDVIVEGVSLVMNYRSQFKEALLNGTPEQLIERVRERAAERNS